MIYESPLEHYRIRRVIIYYYLEDDTIAIYEIPYENSALLQVAIIASKIVACLFLFFNKGHACSSS